MPPAASTPSMRSTPRWASPGRVRAASRSCRTATATRPPLPRCRPPAYCRRGTPPGRSSTTCATSDRPRRGVRKPSAVAVWARLPAAGVGERGGRRGPKHLPAIARCGPKCDSVTTGVADQGADEPLPQRADLRPCPPRSYPGPWLPEGVFTADGALGPLETVEQRDSVSIALLTVMERLTSAERAAFVLREAFAYSHSDIADILDTSEANDRQLHRRARQRLEEPKPRFRPDPAHWRALVERFLDAARGGDVNGLAAMLADQVSSTADGGGQVGAARRIVTGRDRVARYLAGGFRRGVIGVRLDLDAEVNGEQAVLAFVGPGVAAVLFFDNSDDRVAALRIL